MNILSKMFIDFEIGLSALILKNFAAWWRFKTGQAL